MAGYLSVLLLILLSHKAFSQTLQQKFKVTNIPISSWIPQGVLAETECDYHYCTFLCLTNLNLCSAFTINSEGQCEIGTISAYIPLRLDGPVGIKVYISNSAKTTAGQAPQLSLATVPHFEYFTNGVGLYDYSLNSTLSPALAMPAALPQMIAEIFTYNFYRAGKIYVCGYSQTCYSASLGDASFVVEANQTMLDAHYFASFADMGDIFWVAGGADAVGTYTANTEYWQDDEWHVGPAMPTALCCHSMTPISPTKVFLVSGFSPTEGYITNTWIYDFKTGIWTATSSYPGSAVAFQAMASMTLSDGKPYAFVLGGANILTQGWIFVNTTFQYDVELDAWTVEPYLLNPRGLGSVTVLDGRVLLIGGVTGPGDGSVADMYDVDAYTPGKGWVNAGELAVSGIMIGGVLYNV